MAEIEKIITITTEIGDTQTKLEAIERQLAILIKENEELAAANKQTTRSYENNSKAIQELTTDIQVKNQRLGELKTKLDSTKSSTDKLTTATQSNRKSVLDNGGAMGLLGAATGGLAMDFKDATEAIQLTGVSLKGLRGALIATGIGALAIVVLELVTNWEKWSGVIDGSTKKLEKNEKALKQLNNEIGRYNSQTQFEIDLAEQRGASDEQLYNARIRQIIGLIEFKKKEKQALEETYRLELSRDRDGKEAEEARLARNTKSLEIQGLEQQAILLNAKFRNTQREEDKKTTISIKEEVVKRKKALGEEIESLDLLALAREKAAGIVKRLEVAEEESPIEKLRRQYEEERAILEAANESTLQLTADFNLNMLALKQEQKNKTIKIDTEQAEDEKTLYEGKINLLGAVGNAIGNLSAIAKQDSAQAKALAIAQATINTFLGISEVWRAKNIYPEPYGTAIKVASTIAVGAAGFANVKNIVNTKVPGGGGWFCWW